MQIGGKLAVVTGGGSGLGEATAKKLAGLGAEVAVLDLNVDTVDGFSIACDVGEGDAVASALESVFAHFGRAPQIAVNCAGIGLAARIVGREGKTSIDLFERTIRVNLIGTYNVMTHSARLMMDADPDGEERGVIINTASVAYQDGQLGQSAYAASKGAIASMCLPAAREFAQNGIRVNAIAPGLFQTPMMEGLPEEVAQKIAANVPFPHRLGMPEEYALLASQIIENPYINGTTIRLDGAVRLPPR